MAITVRIATFNLENLDDKPGNSPSLSERIEIIRPQLIRLNADILCLQEVNGQEIEGEPRQLLALQELIANTPYETYFLATTTTSQREQVYDVRNLVILSRFRIVAHQQYRNDKISPPEYRKVTASPAEEAKEVDWERPILKADIQLPGERLIHVINVHLKSKIPSNIDGQKRSKLVWRSASGWAEGFFISSMKRVGQALETRVIIDEIFDQDEEAYVAVCGDFNAECEEVPVQAIRGDVENTGNTGLVHRVLVACEKSIPKTERYTLLYHGKGQMIDHVLVSRNMLQFYRNAEIHNEMLHDESIAYAGDKKYPESDHAPLVAEFLFDW